MMLMSPDLTAPSLTFLFLAIVLSLGTALVWMLWELEQRAQRQRPARQRTRPDR